MAVMRNEPPKKGTPKGNLSNRSPVDQTSTSKVKFPDASRSNYDLDGSNFGGLLALVGAWILLLWLIVGIVALFFGWAGGQWGWGFGFGWYLPLLAAVVVAMAGMGIYATLKICLRR